MSNQSRTRGPKRRAMWFWLGGAIAVLVLVVAGVFTAPRLLQSDPCELALPFALELGLQLSDGDEILSCEWHTSFPDSSGTVIVRTPSKAAREELLERSGVSEEVYEWSVSSDHRPTFETTHRPNLERSEQVYKATASSGHQLTISYDEEVESGLLLTVRAREL